MDKYLAIKLAQTEHLPTLETMKRANQIFTDNSTDWDKPFAEQDICYMGLMIHMQDLSEEVKDYSYISNKLNRVFNHIFDVSRNQQLTKFEEEECATTYKILKKYNITYLLDDYFKPIDILKACGE